MTRTRKAIFALLACFSLLLPGVGALGIGAAAAEGEAGTDTQCSDDENLLLAADQNLEWGLRESFRKYVVGGIAQGEITTADGATFDGETFSFPVVDGTYDRAAQTGTMNFAGTMHFTGHNGMLDTTISNPVVEITSPTTAKLWANVISADIGKDPVDYGKVHFADVTLDTNSYGAPILSLAGQKVLLTEAGSKAFAGFYSAGEALDPIKADVSMIDPEPCTTEVTTVAPTATDNEGTGFDTVTIPEVEGVEYLIDGVVVSGTYAVPSGTENVTVTAQAKDGYALSADSVTSWDFAFSIEEPTPTETEEPAPTETEEPAPTETEEPAPSETEEPEPDCSDVEGQMKVDSGQLSFGIKESFRNYIVSGPAKGEWTMDNGATQTSTGFDFPVQHGKLNDNGTGYVQYVGGVRATGHHGLLNTYFANPKLVFDGSPKAKLLFHVVSNDMSGKSTDYGVVHFADVTLDTHKFAKGQYTMGGAKVVLTAAGSKAFAGFYKPGQALDPAMTTLKVSQANSCDPEAPAPGPVNPPKPPNTKPVNPPKPPAVDKPVNPPAPPAADPAPHKDPAKQCTPDPNKMRVTGGTLSWGLRKSFTTYVRGSIAQGGWDTTGGASWNGSTFVFPAVSGNYDNATKKGTINYSGTVHFTGHHGILDTVLSNPSLVVTGNSAQLYMTVTSQDMEGNRTNFGRVHFANVSLSNVSLSGGTMSLQSSSVTLTAAGAKAFAGFYSPGEPLDQLSSTVKMAPGSVCDPETGELKVYGADGKLYGTDGKLVKTGAEVGQLGLAAALFLMTGLAMSAASRRRRA